MPYHALGLIQEFSWVLLCEMLNSASSYVANNVRDLGGLKSWFTNYTGVKIITASIPNHPPGDAGLLHGIGGTPDQSEVWQNSSGTDPHVYVWDMRNPFGLSSEGKDSPLRSRRGSHWLTFDIKGDYGYVSPIKK